MKKIKINNEITIGENLVIIAGPCSIESYDQTYTIAKSVKKSGANILRGGAFKPRTSPDSFQGLKEEGLKILHKVGKDLGMPVISEIISETQIPMFEKYVDIIQVGARNMSNYNLLKNLGKTNKPIMLKRGMSSTIEEWILASKYISENGNKNIIFCERGIRTFETYTRNMLDISSIYAIQNKTKYPIIIDPSHAAGTWELVEPLTLAAVAAGANGVMIEVHNDPKNALSDGPQSLKPKKFNKLMVKVKKLNESMKELNNDN